VNLCTSSNSATSTTHDWNSVIQALYSAATIHKTSEMTHIIITLTIQIDVGEEVRNIPWLYTTWEGKQAPFTSQLKRLKTTHNIGLLWKHDLVPMRPAKMKEEEWNSSVQNGAWGYVLAHVLRFITPNCICDSKMEKQSTQNLVNIITIISELLFYQLHFL
jgi:hypothetical protein